MKMERGKFCPLIKEDCIQNKCMWWVHLLGRNPQTEEPIDEWDCAVYWQPILLVENAQKMREAGAEINKFRNELVKLSLSARAERAALTETPETKVIDDIPRSDDK